MYNIKSEKRMGNTSFKLGDVDCLEEKSRNVMYENPSAPLLTWSWNDALFIIQPRYIPTYGINNSHTKAKFIELAWLCMYWKLMHLNILDSLLATYIT